MSDRLNRILAEIAAEADATKGDLDVEIGDHITITRGGLPVSPEERERIVKAGRGE